MRTLRTPENFCPYCNYKIDGVSDAFGLNSPSEGDLSICLGCGGFLQFGQNLAVQKLEPAVLEEIKQEEPETYQQLLQYSNAAKKVQRESDRNG